MNKLESYRVLLAHIYAARGPDQELDATVCHVLGIAPVLVGSPPAERLAYPGVTASLDAALTLKDRLLPNWRWERQWEPGGEFIRLLAPDYHAHAFKGARNRRAAGWCSCQSGDAIALLEALIRALIKSEEEATARLTVL